MCESDSGRMFVSMSINDISMASGTCSQLGICHTCLNTKRDELLSADIDTVASDFGNGTLVNLEECGEEVGGFFCGSFIYWSKWSDNRLIPTNPNLLLEAHLRGVQYHRQSHLRKEG